jgi:RimJ/RimL family protein N-acetyltransferase
VNVEVNELGQQVGPSVPGWRPRPVPTRASLAGGLPGGSCRLEPLDAAAHAEPLFTADALDVTGSSWTYLPYGPFPNLPTYRAWLEEVSAQTDPIFLAVVDTAQWPGRAVGVASYLRMQPDAGSIEVGHLHFSSLLQRRTAATEAQYLLMRHVFDDLGYRRYEWKCDVLNAPSRAAPNGSASPMRAPFDRQPSSAAETGTPPGSPSWTVNGPVCAPASKPGSTLTTGPTAPPAAHGVRWAPAAHANSWLLRLVMTVYGSVLLEAPARGSRSASMTSRCDHEDR